MSPCVAKIRALIVFNYQRLTQTDFLVVFTTVFVLVQSIQQKKQALQLPARGIIPAKAACWLYLPELVESASFSEHWLPKIDKQECL